MEPIRAQLRTRPEESVQVVSQNGSVTILDGGMPLLAGGERDGRLHLRFTEDSGAHAEFEVTGSSNSGELHLSGAGNVCLGGLALDNATVRVTHAGIEIAAPVEWADQQMTVRFEAGVVVGQWHGRVEAREMLSCLITRREVLRTSITIELDACARSSTYRALAVLDGRNIKVLPATESHSEEHELLSRFRQKTLAAVREFLVDELAEREAELAAVDADDDDATEASADTPVLFDPTVRDSNTSRTTASVRPHQHGSGTPTAGYLPTSPNVARTSGSQSNAAVRGYLDPRHAAPTPARQGYLPASPGEKRGATGYLPNSRTTEVKGASGYSPGDRRGATGPGPSARAMLHAEPDDRTRTSQTAPRESVNAVIDFGRIAYAVLRCKDLLGALDTAERKGAGA